MPISQTFVARETARRVRRANAEIGEHVRRLRLDAGVSLGELARLVGVHRSHLARIESGATHPSIAVLTAIGVALGADLSVRYFPGTGPRLHDRFQAAMVEALLRELDARWRIDLEVPISRPARGVIDLVLTDRAGSPVVAAEAQSQIRRLEEQIRWAAEKADGLANRLERDDRGPSARTVSRLLILRSTLATREIARQYHATLAAAYPAATTAVVRSLTSSGVPWPGAGIVWMRFDGGRAVLMRHPPRGVDLGQ
jgi:transcriptional regulator with XRE-family HTH domain